jgi:hypothetical protein
MQFSANQQIRILRVYSLSSKVNVSKYNIIDLLTKSIRERIQELEEADVLSILKIYETLDR